MPCNTIPYHAMSGQVRSGQVRSGQVMQHHVMPHDMTWHHVTSHHFTSHHILSMPCHKYIQMLQRLSPSSLVGFVSVIVWIRWLCHSIVLNWPIVSLLILFILFSNVFCILVHVFTLCFIGFPCSSVSYYNYVCMTLLYSYSIQILESSYLSLFIKTILPSSILYVSKSDQNGWWYSFCKVCR